LFLADRNILADQAYNAFLAFPDDALVRIDPTDIRKKGRVPKNGSIFFTIFQTFMSGPPVDGKPAPYFGEYPADFFDFIVIDECHRGGANDEGTWRAILDNFALALQLGLTAIPKRTINADTYSYFGEPVFVYSLKEGINDGFLTPFKVRQIAITLDEYVYVSDDVVVAGKVNEVDGATGATSPAQASPAISTQGGTETPDEALRKAHAAITGTLAADLLDRVRKATPVFFEKLIVELLLAMGYGGTFEEAGRALGQSGDDGVIDQDPLGVDQIFVQAKRYAEGNNISAGAIRDFYGALSLKKAHKGIFVTTSAFSQPAIDAARGLGSRIVLIDGLQLSRLMIRYNVGCRDEDVLHLKQVDENFFEGQKPLRLTALSDALKCRYEPVPQLG